jgi:hypothetical protein
VTRHGSAVNPPPRDLRDTFRAVLDALVEVGIAYAFIGALPVLAWGRVRATTDIDLVVLAASGWDAFVDALSRRGINMTKQVGPIDPSHRLPDIAVFQTSGDRGIRVDVFIAKTAFEEAVVATARIATVLDLPVRLARPEASIIYKLLAQRRRDLDDVDGIFEVRQAANEALDWEFLDHWASEWHIVERLAPYRARFRRPELP